MFTNINASFEIQKQDLKVALISWETMHLRLNICKGLWLMARSDRWECNELKKCKYSMAYQSG